MTTPSSRFTPNKRICLSMSDLNCFWIIVAFASH
ncbi:hypothetical protein SEVIR_4G120882v4 [Setaria viridis]